jgi:hypothetical protein
MPFSTLILGTKVPQSLFSTTSKWPINLFTNQNPDYIHTYYMAVCYSETSTNSYRSTCRYILENRYPLLISKHWFRRWNQVRLPWQQESLKQYITGCQHSATLSHKILRPPYAWIDFNCKSVNGVTGMQSCVKHAFFVLSLSHTLSPWV